MSLILNHDSPQKVTLPAVDEGSDEDTVDTLLDTSDEPPPYSTPVVGPNAPQKVSRELRNLQQTPKCWLPVL